jgi:hypothetical protein
MAEEFLLQAQPKMVYSSSEILPKTSSVPITKIIEEISPQAEAQPKLSTGNVQNLPKNVHTLAEPPKLPNASNHGNQSLGLSNRHINMHKDGRTLVDDSNISEGNLKTIIEPLIEWTKCQIEPYGGSIQYLKKISLDDLEKKNHNPEHIIGCSTNNNHVNTRVSIKPDAGIIIWTYKNIQYPIYICEDKVQGTNDKLFKDGKSRQATGNAIERYFKNVRAEEMLCSHVPYFPSVVFASGCDFHHSETISKRLEAGNYAIPNNYIEVASNNPDNFVSNKLKNIINNISIRKKFIGRYSPFVSIPIVCIKAHKWNDMEHNSSLWKPDEYMAISKRIIELAIKEVVFHS